MLSVEARSHGTEETARLTALREHGSSEGGGPDVEAIGQDDGFAPEELLGFAGGELADGSEDVGLVCGELLYLVLGFDTQLACHLVAVVGIHIGI